MTTGRLRPTSLTAEIIEIETEVLTALIHLQDLEHELGAIAAKVRGLLRRLGPAGDASPDRIWP